MNLLCVKQISSMPIPLEHSDESLGSVIRKLPTSLPKSAKDIDIISVFKSPNNPVRKFMVREVSDQPKATQPPGNTGLCLQALSYRAQELSMWIPGLNCLGSCPGSNT